MLIDKPRFPVKAILLCGFLPSFLKVLIYRLKGYKIGKGVSIGLGSVICSKDVIIGDYTRMGFFSFIRGSKTRLGSHVEIGSGTLIDTPNLEIGDGTKINEQVFVGGLQFPDSTLKIGRNCQVMQMTFINPTRSITIGDDTGIGGDCLLFGHTSWLSQFEGYPVDFQPIEIGSSVSIAWRVFLLPGSKVGDGCVVGANSLVNRSIPSRCLALGFPAKVVSKAPYFPRDVKDDEKVKYLNTILESLVQFLEQSGTPCRRQDQWIEVTQRGRRWWQSSRTLRMVYETQPLLATLAKSFQEHCHVFLSLRAIPHDLRNTLARDRIMWIDIESKERSDYGNDLGEEVVLFLRRYGVRFFRVS